MKTPVARARALIGAVALLCLSGCANLSGLDGTSSYGCKAPEGVKCDSVSGTYYNAIQNNLPSQRRSAPPGQSELPPAAGPAGPAGGVRSAPAMVPTSTQGTSSAEGTAYLATPLRAAPKILRLWIKPWEDADRDLNGESLVYVQVDNGRWLVDHVQRQAREPYAPVRPTKLPASAAKGSASDTGNAAVAPADSGASISQALRTLQGRAPNTADN